MAGTIVASNMSDGTSTGSTTDMIKGACRAWVNFNGTGTVAIRAAYNVSSITDDGTGTYTINFTNAMSDTNYVLSGASGTGTTAHLMSGYRAVQLTTSHQIVTFTGSGVATDMAYVGVAFHR